MKSIPVHKSLCTTADCIFAHVSQAGWWVPTELLVWNIAYMWMWSQCKSPRNYSIQSSTPHTSLACQTCHPGENLQSAAPSRSPWDDQIGQMRNLSYQLPVLLHTEHRFRTVGPLTWVSRPSSASQGLGVSSQGCPYVSRPAVQPVIKLIR